MAEQLEINREPGKEKAKKSPSESPLNSRDQRAAHTGLAAPFQGQSEQGMGQN